MSFWLSLWLFVAPFTATQDLEKDYIQGLTFSRNKQHKQAITAFKRLLPKLKATQQQRTKGTKDWHIMTLGQSDVLYHIGYNQWQLKQRRRACETFFRIQKMRASLPKSWSTWGVHPDLPARLKRAQSLFTSYCPLIPSHITFHVSPKRAYIELKRKGRWLRLSNMTLQTKQTSLTIRVMASFHLPNTQTIALPRWSHKHVHIKLRKAPKIVARRQPPKRLPVAKKPDYGWGVWVGVGAVIVGGGVTTALVLTAKTNNHIVSKDNQPPKLW